MQQTRHDHKLFLLRPRPSPLSNSERRQSSGFQGNDLMLKGPKHCQDSPTVGFFPPYSLRDGGSVYWLETAQHAPKAARTQGSRLFFPFPGDICCQCYRDVLQYEWVSLQMHQCSSRIPTAPVIFCGAAKHATSSTPTLLLQTQAKPEKGSEVSITLLLICDPAEPDSLISGFGVCACNGKESGCAVYQSRSQQQA